VSAPARSVAATELRAFCMLDHLHARYAAFLGTVVQGDLPTPAMAALFVEVAPGNEVFRLVDVALKAAPVRPGAQVVEREFGLIELHHAEHGVVRKAGRAVLETLGWGEAPLPVAALVAERVIKRVDPYQAQLINRRRRGTALVPGECLLVLECAPAAFANLLANEAVRQANVDLIDVIGVGRYGRLWASGPEAEVERANAALRATLARQAEVWAV
jgi:hypothetical protein